MRITAAASKAPLSTFLVALLVLSTLGGNVINGYTAGQGVATAPELVVGETLANEGFEEIRSAFKVGFGSLEPDGIWMNENDALIAFRPEGFGASLEAVFDVVPLIGGERTSLTLYSQTTGDWVVHDLAEGLNQIRVPLPSGEVQSVAFACGKLASPSELGISSDTRALCVKFVSLELVRAGSEPEDSSS